MSRASSLRTRKKPPPISSCENYDMDTDGYFDTSESEEENDSDWAAPTQRTHPVKKRAKLTSGTVKIAKGRKSLSVLPLSLLPLDLLYEIFACLSPKDLLALIRTSKPLRKVLLTRNATMVWRMARDNIGVPAPFSDTSEPRWAALIFGSKSCESCGTTGGPKVDFALRRRVCVACKKANLVVESKFPLKFPDYERKILDYTVHTNVGGWAHGHPSSSKFYWASDVDDIGHQIARLNNDVHMRKPGASKALSNFYTARLALVEHVVQHARTCTSWHLDYESSRVVDRYSRYNAIVKRFKNLSYDERDICIIKWEREAIEGKELTDRIWNRVQPILEPIIIQAKEARLAKERGNLVHSRIKILELVFISYIKTLRPIQWRFLPSIFEVAEFSPFHDVIQAPNDVNVTPASFTALVDTLPALIADWSEERKISLLHMLTASKENLPKECLLPALIEDGQIIHTPISKHTCPDHSVDPLSLATAVFQCRDSCLSDNSAWGTRISNVLIGWDEVNSHQCKRYHQLDYHDYHYSNREVPSLYKSSPTGSAAASALVSAAKLRPHCATAHDMDDHAFLFFCKKCGPQSHAGGYGYEVFTWRAAVGHDIYKHPGVHNWHLLTSEERKIAIPLLSADPIDKDPSWTCNHCAIHWNNYRSRALVVEHLRTIHGISDPKSPDDLFFLPQKRVSPIKIPIFRQTPPKPPQIKCKHCPAKNRSFHLVGVKDHIRAKHQITNPVENVDWVKSKG